MDSFGGETEKFGQGDQTWVRPYWQQQQQQQQQQLNLVLPSTGRQVFYSQPEAPRKESLPTLETDAVRTKREQAYYTRMSGYKEEADAGVRGGGQEAKVWRSSEGLSGWLHAWEDQSWVPGEFVLGKHVLSMRRANYLSVDIDLLNSSIVEVPVL